MEIRRRSGSFIIGKGRRRSRVKVGSRIFLVFAIFSLAIAALGIVVNRNVEDSERAHHSSPSGAASSQNFEGFISR